MIRSCRCRFFGQRSGRHPTTAGYTSSHDRTGRTRFRRHTDAGGLKASARNPDATQVPMDEPPLLPPGAPLAGSLRYVGYCLSQLHPPDEAKTTTALKTSAPRNGLALARSSSRHPKCALSHQHIGPPRVAAKNPVTVFHEPVGLKTCREPPGPAGHPGQNSTRRSALAHAEEHGILLSIPLHSPCVTYHTCKMRATPGGNPPYSNITIDKIKC